MKRSSLRGTVTPEVVCAQCRELMDGIFQVDHGTFSGTEGVVVSLVAVGLEWLVVPQLDQLSLGQAHHIQVLSIYRRSVRPSFQISHLLHECARKDELACHCPFESFQLHCQHYSPGVLGLDRGGWQPHGFYWCQHLSIFQVLVKVDSHTINWQVYHCWVVVRHIIAGAIRHVAWSCTL